MRIGLTYDLRAEYLAMGYGEEETAEFDREETIDEIEKAIRELGYETDRIGHFRRLVERLAGGDRWDLVFNIAEGLRGIGREAQVPAILDAFGIPYTFSDPLVMTLTLHKGMTKRVIRDAGIPTCDFSVVESEADSSAIRFKPPYFVKPVAEGTSKGITSRSIVSDRAGLWPLCADLIGEYAQPVLVEEYLSGREFTVGVVGAEVIGTLEMGLRPGAESGVYSYINKEQCEKLVDYILVRPDADPVIREVERIALECWRVIGCRDAGRIDLRCDAFGKPQFIEANPLAGLHPTHSDLPILCNKLGIPYVELINRILHSALARARRESVHTGS
ncbi:MAG: D-alanine--D-alanine ligase [Candidatus Krumholzibacteria bacterium]|nr:D-alanine--D-alanine ligase [Candidatus Krumholzibacteria bacterium]